MILQQLHATGCQLILTAHDVIGHRERICTDSGVMLLQMPAGLLQSHVQPCIYPGGNTHLNTGIENQA